MRLSTVTIAIAALAGSIASANAMPPVRAGILQCEGGQNVGYPFQAFGFIAQKFG